MSNLKGIVVDFLVEACPDLKHSDISDDSLDYLLEGRAQKLPPSLLLKLQKKMNAYYTDNEDLKAKVGDYDETLKLPKISDVKVLNNP